MKAGFQNWSLVKEMVMPGMGLLFWSNAVTVIVDPDNPVVCTTGLGLALRVMEFKTGVEDGGLKTTGRVWLFMFPECA